MSQNPPVVGCWKHGGQRDRSRSPEVKLRSKLGFRCVYKSLLTACLVRIWFSSLLNSCFRLGNSGGMVSTMEGYLKQTRVIHILSSHDILNSVG